MSFLSGIGDLAQTVFWRQHPQQRSRSGTALRPGSAGGAHFYARQRAWPKHFAPDKLQPFPQMAAQLFANGNSQQQAGVLNGLMATLGPAVIAKFAGSAPNSPLAAHAAVRLGYACAGGERSAPPMSKP